MIKFFFRFFVFLLELGFLAIYYSLTLLLNGITLPLYCLFRFLHPKKCCRKPHLERYGLLLYPSWRYGTHVTAWDHTKAVHQNCSKPAKQRKDDFDNFDIYFFDLLD